FRLPRDGAAHRLQRRPRFGRAAASSRYRTGTRRAASMWSAASTWSEASIALLETSGRRGNTPAIQASNLIRRTREVKQNLVDLGRFTGNVEPRTGESPGMSPRPRAKSFPRFVSQRGTADRTTKKPSQAVGLQGLRRWTIL